MTLHKFIYHYEGNVFLGERFPSQEVIIQSKCDDLDAHEILNLFKSYMLATGYAEKSFYDACEEAAHENPYRKDRPSSGDGHKLGETDQIHHSWHDNIQLCTEKTDQIYTNPIKDMLS